MLNALRRLRAHWAARAEVGLLQQWAESHGLELRRVRGIQGCVLEGRMAGHAGRIEWGPSQRPYVQGQELRLLADATTPDDLMALVLNRQLQEAMESSVYQQYVDDVQTRIDADAPPEMRWLVMLDRLDAAHLGAMKSRYAVFGNRPDWVARWMATPLSDALTATMDTLPASQPMVLSARNGRLLLRTPMPVVDHRLLAQCLSVFEHAAREARRMDPHARPAVSAGPQTQPATWSPELTSLRAAIPAASVQPVGAAAAPGSAAPSAEPLNMDLALDLTLPEDSAAPAARTARSAQTAKPDSLPSGFEPVSVA